MPDSTDADSSDAPDDADGQPPPKRMRPSGDVREPGRSATLDGWLVRPADPEPEEAVVAPARADRTRRGSTASPPERLERGMLPARDEHSARRIAELAHACDERHPGMFDINSDRIYCTACQTTLPGHPLECNSQSLSTHYTKSTKCAAARARLKSGISRFFGRRPSNLEAETARALLRDRRRDCMGYHFPSIRIKGNGHAAPIDVPISVLWG